MARKPLNDYEMAARALCAHRKQDANELTFLGGKDSSNKAPRWCQVAAELRSHDERTVVLELHGGKKP